MTASQPSDTVGRWETVEIGGRPADIFTPVKQAVADRAVLFLHGASEKTIRDDPVFSAELSRHGLPAVCPHGGRSWWLDRICRQFDDALTPMAYLRQQVVPWMREQWVVQPPAIGLLGISMGGQGVLQLSYRHPREFPVAAAISPAVDFQNIWGHGTPLDEMFTDPEAARQETATLHLHPLNWPRHQMFVCDPTDTQWYEGAERLASKLYSMGIPFECDLETTAGGHSWDYFRAMAKPCLTFIAQHLAAVP